MGRVALAYERNAAFWAGRLTERLALALGDDVISTVDDDLDRDPTRPTDSLAGCHGLIAVVSHLDQRETDQPDVRLHLAISLAIRAIVPILVVDLHDDEADDPSADPGAPDDELGSHRVVFDVRRFDAEADRCAAVIQKWIGDSARFVAPLELADATVPAFVGLSARVPNGGEGRGVAVKISTWRQFVGVFGEPDGGALMPAAVSGWFANGGRDCYVVSIGQSPDPSPDKVPLSVDDIIGGIEPASGLLGLGMLEDVTVLALPDLTTMFADAHTGAIDLEALMRAQLAAIEHAEAHQCMVILDPPPGMTPQQVNNWRNEVAGYDSRHAAIYYPWVSVEDPAGWGRPIDVPPCGHVAGVWASVERERGVWAAPANRTMKGVARCERRLTRDERFLLELIGINPLRDLDDLDVRPWGSKTMSSELPFARLELTRTLLAVARACERGLEWASFEPNDVATRSLARRRVEAFLARLWRAGALAGADQSQAFVVHCDEQVSPPDAPVRVVVGIAPETAGDLLWFSVGGSHRGWVAMGDG